MDVRKGMLWYLVNGAMELSWFLGWAMFCSLMTMHRPFPFFETIIAFALAGFVTHLSTGKGWRIASVIGIEILGLMCAALLVIHGIYYGSYSLLDSGWLAVFFDGPRGVLEWFILSLNLFLIMILWTGGVTLARRPKEYYSACNRFDLGLAAFFALFVIKLIALTKGEVMAEDSLSLHFVYPFFLFGLLSIGMARMPGDRRHCELFSGRASRDRRAAALFPARPDRGRADGVSRTHGCRQAAYPCIDCHLTFCLRTTRQSS
jgi:hypothetical protein